VQPLDLLVFRGGDFVSNLISNLETSELGCGDVTHVGVAINRRLCPSIKDFHPNASKDLLYIWESTLSGHMTDGIPHAETGKSKFGVQLRVLEDVVGGYLKNKKANVGVAKLKNNPAIRREGESDEDYKNRRKGLKQQIHTVYVKYNHTSYNGNVLNLFGALFPKLRPLRNAAANLAKKFHHEHRWLFCSEFAAVLYEAIGVINDDTDGVHDGKLLDPRDVVPMDFLGYDEDHMLPIVELPPMWVRQAIHQANQAAEKLKNEIDQQATNLQEMILQPHAEHGQPKRRVEKMHDVVE